MNVDDSSIFRRDTGVKRPEMTPKWNFHDESQIFIICLGLKLLIKRKRCHDVGVLPRGALEMLNGRRKWREKTENDAGNKIFMIKARYSSLAWASRSQ